MIFLAAIAAAVAVASPSPTPSPIPEITHVSTSDRSDETLRNTVRTTYIVTAAEIARDGYRTISDAIAHVPGVQIASYGTIGAAAQYGIRGSASTEVLVLVDGVPAPGGLDDTVQLGSMSTAGVQRIEIVEGGGSTLYGTGAMGGIINIITNTQKAEPSATLRWGTFDDREAQLNAGGFSVERIVANNAFAVPPSGGALGPNPDTRANSDYEASNARYGLKAKLGAIDMAFHASAGSDDLGAAGLFPSYSTTSREHDLNEGADLGLSHASPRSTASLTLFGSSQKVTFGCIYGPATSPLDPNCFQPSPSLDTETRTGLSLRDVISGKSERTMYGVDLSRGTVSVNDGAGDPVASDALAQSAAYAQQTWIGATDELYAGLRAERDGSLGGEFSPSIGARFDFSPAVTLKVNAATAFRAPNATELYYPFYGSIAQNLGSLQPERSELGDASLQDSRLLGGTTLAWFDNAARNLILPTCVQFCDVATNPPNVFPVYAPQNIARAHIAGFTLDTRTVPLNGYSVSLSATDLYLAQNLTLQTRLPDDPVFSVTLGLQYNGPSNAFVRSAGVSERVVGERTGGVGPIDPTQPLFFQPAAYSDLTAFASFRLSARAALTLRGFNLGNERYADVAGYPMPGRTFAVELTTH